MAKEVELKRIELKVSVNCCDGCKRKVKKALRNVQGVVKTEIDPWQPKLTVIGNVEPGILIKKLSKVGKQAQLERKGTGQEEKEKPNADSYTIDKTNYADKGKRRASKEEKEIVTETYKEVIKNEAPPPQPQQRDQVSFNMYPSMGNSQYGYKVAEPYAPPMPCYALPSYSYPPMAAPSYDYYNYNYNYSRPVAFQDPVMQAGDYFSDENTTGCHIM